MKHSHNEGEGLILSAVDPDTSSLSNDTEKNILCGRDVSLMESHVFPTCFQMG